MSALHTMTTILGVEAMRRVADWLELPLTDAPVIDQSDSTSALAPIASTTSSVEAPTTAEAVAPESGSCDDASPADLPEDAADRLRDVLGGLPSSSETCRYVGAVAASRGVADAVRPLIPEGGRVAYDEGADAHGKSLRVPRPAELDDAGQRRLVRALDRAARSDGDASPASPAEAPKIVRLVRRTAGPRRGGIFDVTIAHGGASVTITGLTGAALLAYGQVCAAALGEGLVLPELGKKCGAIWRDALATAMASVVVESVAGDEDVATATEEEIVRCLRDSPRVSDVSEMTEPGLACLQDNWIVVRGADVVRTVRASLADDRVSRTDVAEAARRLGLDARPYRPRVADGTQPSLWRMPASLLGGSSEVSDAP